MPGKVEEYPIEVSQRLEPGLECNLTNAQIRIQQQFLHALDPQSRQIRGDRKTRAALEQLAKVKLAQVNFASNSAGGNVLAVMLRNELLRPADDCRLTILRLNKHLIAQAPELLRENAQQLERRPVFLGRKIIAASTSSMQKRN